MLGGECEPAIGASADAASCHRANTPSLGWQWEATQGLRRAHDKLDARALAGTSARKLDRAPRDVAFDRRRRWAGHHVKDSRRQACESSASKYEDGAPLASGGAARADGNGSENEVTRGCATANKNALPAMN